MAESGIETIIAELFKNQLTKELNKAQRVALSAADASQSPTAYRAIVQSLKKGAEARIEQVVSLAPEHFSPLIGNAAFTLDNNQVNEMRSLAGTAFFEASGQKTKAEIESNAYKLFEGTIERELRKAIEKSNFGSFDALFARISDLKISEIQDRVATAIQQLQAEVQESARTIATALAAQQDGMRNTATTTVFEEWKKRVEQAYESQQPAATHSSSTLLNSESTRRVSKTGGSSSRDHSTNPEFKGYGPSDHWQKNWDPDEYKWAR